MSGIGEASAIISVVELGFSLATALNTYVCSVSAAPDDVSSLSSEIEATLSHLRGLESLITKNEETKAWDKDGLDLARGSITDCERIVKKLRRLLQKASRKESENEQIAFVKSEIDLTKFERALWPRLKPQLEVCKSELQRIKLNIILAHHSYMIGTVSTEAEKMKHREAIRGTNLAREWNARKIKRARDRRNKPPGSGPGPIPYVHAESPMPSPMPMPMHGYSFMENEMDIELHEDFERFLEQEEEREEEEARQLVLDREARKRELDEERKEAIEEKAVNEYVRKLKKAEAEAKKNRDELRRKLENRAGLTQQQIDLIIDDVYPRSGDNALLLLQTRQISEEETGLVADSNDNQNHDGSDSVRGISRFTSFRRLLRPNSGNEEINSNKPLANTLSSAWRDPATKTGFAKLESWYISTDTSGTGCRQMPAPLPQSWMLKALMEAENGNLKYSKRFPPVWEVLLSLSPELISQVNDLLEERADRKPNYDWSILLIDRPKAADNRRSVFFGPFKFYLEDKEEEVNDIYVVLKYEENPSRKRSKSRSRPRSTSTDSVLSENSITPRRPSTSMMPERSRSISRRMSSISRARSTLRNPNSPEDIYDSYYQRTSRRPSQRSSSRVWYDDSPMAAKNYQYSPSRYQAEEYITPADEGRSRPPSHPRPIIVSERPQYDRSYRQPMFSSPRYPGPANTIYSPQPPGFQLPVGRPYPPGYPSPGVASYPSYGREPDYPSDHEHYPEQNPTARHPQAQQSRRTDRSPIRDYYYDGGGYEVDVMQSERRREPSSRGSMPIYPVPPIRRTNSSGRERQDSEDSDSDESHSRQGHDLDTRRRRERQAQRYPSGRRRSITRDLRAAVRDEHEEEELLSTEKAIVDRLVAKHTRPLAKGKIPDGERMSNGNGDVGETHIPARLSDILELDESDSRGKEDVNGDEYVSD